MKKEKKKLVTFYQIKTIFRFYIKKLQILIYSLIKNNFILPFLLILLLGLYLRFYNIQFTQGFAWDQARDCWIVRDILQGRYTLIGPRTGIGHFHIGPLYYYLLVPFFFLTHLDPMASNYLNIIANVCNIFIIYFVTKKIYNGYAALFVSTLYSLSHYIIETNRTPWNVTLMPGIAALIFYGIVKIYQGKYSWIFITFTLAGFFFQLHFTAIFLPFIIFLSLLFVKNKRKVIKYMFFSIPLYVMWFIPNIINELQARQSDYFHVRDFLSNYFIGFHFRFLLHRLPDAFIQFKTILYYHPYQYLTYVIPGSFLLMVIFLEKDKWRRLLGYLISLWFIIPLIGFTLYGGPVSEYYFLSSVPMVLYCFYSLQEKMLRSKYKLMIIPILIIFWSIYIYTNTYDFWVKPTSGGLAAQKEDVLNTIHRGESIEFEIGDIRSYLYQIWVKDKRL